MTRRYLHKSRFGNKRSAVATPEEIAAYEQRPEVIRDREAKERRERQEEEWKRQVEAANKAEKEMWDKAAEGVKAQEKAEQGSAE